MKGMSVDQHKEVLDFVQKHHTFYRVKPENRLQRNGDDFTLSIKYIDICYDTRDASIWAISFRGWGKVLRFATNHFTAVSMPPAGFTFTNLYDWVMAYLKGEWSDRAVLESCSKSES